MKSLVEKNRSIKFRFIIVDDKSTDGFRQIQELQGCFVYDIREDSNGNIWLATYANGAFRYDINEKRWKNYLHEVDKEIISQLQPQ